MSTSYSSKKTECLGTSRPEVWKTSVVRLEESSLGHPGASCPQTYVQCRRATRLRASGGSHVAHITGPSSLQQFRPRTQVLTPSPVLFQGPPQFPLHHSEMGTSQKLRRGLSVRYLELSTATAVKPWPRYLCVPDPPTSWEGTPCDPQFTCLM